jgi:pimeloyl-ACP methyl ester carboxylesterase
MASRSKSSIFSQFWAPIAGLCVLLLLAPALVNLAILKWEHARNPVPGAFYDVDGAQMHINCTGSGSPTVVLEHAASASYMLWRRVQPKLSQVTRVCSYDRAGHGWSSARGEPRDAKTIVHELHLFLDQAGVQRPFIYVGHSAGGLYVREYDKEFPNELDGVALLEASSPQQINELPGWRKSWEEDILDRRRTLWKDKLRQCSGWDRLFGNCEVKVSGPDEPYAGQYQAMRTPISFLR